jgi:Uma2 family endonuclease
MAFAVTLDSVEQLQQAASGLRLSKSGYIAFCAANRDLRIEREPDGSLTIMPPAFSRTGYQNSEVSGQLREWAIGDGSGVAFDSSAGFDLPDGSNRAPDASWVGKTRLAALPPSERDGFLPLCPDFVIELRSHSDVPRKLREKMQEYIANGAQLGWLIDPFERTVMVFRPERQTEVFSEPSSLSGGAELPGFELQLARVWRPEF